MTLCRSIVAHGRDAVLAYRRMCGSAADNEVPKVSLSSYIARGLHADLNVAVHVERHYEKVATELGLKPDKELKQAIGGYRADVAIYDGRTPKHLLEVKVSDEGGSSAAITKDLEKLRLLSTHFQSLQGYVAVLITETVGTTLEQRVQELGHYLGGTFDELSTPEQANEGQAN